MTYALDNDSPSNDLTSVMAKISDWDTPLLQGDCSPYNYDYGTKVEPDTPEAFKDFEEWSVSSMM